MSEWSWVGIGTSGGHACIAFAYIDAGSVVVVLASLAASFLFFLCSM